MFCRALLLSGFITLGATLVSAAPVLDPGDSAKAKVIVLDGKKARLTEVATLPKILKEASGLEITSRYFWSHNDDGIPALYCLDSTGTLVRAIQMNSSNRGWEDLAQDESGNMYIGSFGNNKNDKKDLKIYKIPPPEGIQGGPVSPQVIKYVYKDQRAFPAAATNKNFDVDAMLAHGNSLYLFTKNRSTPFNGYSKVYRLSQDPGDQIAEVVDSLFVGKGSMINNWITSADISPDKKTIALLFHNRIWLVRNFQMDKLSRATIFQIDLNHYSHKAGICFKDNGTLYIVDELEFDVVGGKLYSLDLKPFLKDLNRK